MTDWEDKAVRSLGYLGVIRGRDYSVSGFTEAEIQAEVQRLQAEYDANQYQRDRATEYPSMEDQLDYIYHNGIEAWKADMILPVKDKYPKQ